MSSFNAFEVGINVKYASESACQRCDVIDESIAMRRRRQKLNQLYFLLGGKSDKCIGT